MDPTANLARQIDLAQLIIDLTDERSDDHGRLRLRDARTIAALADDLAGLVRDLAEWRRNGGFPPAQYARSE